MLTHRYLVVWVWLLGLVAVSLVAGRAPVARPAIATLVFTIAVVKAVLVALHFMHLKVEAWLIYAIAIVPVLLVVGLMLALVPDFVFAR